jgi:hypothetical protein
MIDFSYAVRKKDRTLNGIAIEFSVACSCEERQLSLAFDYLFEGRLQDFHSGNSRIYIKRAPPG